MRSQRGSAYKLNKVREDELFELMKRMVDNPAMYSPGFRDDIIAMANVYQQKRVAEALENIAQAIYSSE